MTLDDSAGYSIFRVKGTDYSSYLPREPKPIIATWDPPIKIFICNDPLNNNFILDFIVPAKD